MTGRHLGGVLASTLVLASVLGGLPGVPASRTATAAAATAGWLAPVAGGSLTDVVVDKSGRATPPIET